MAKFTKFSGSRCGQPLDTLDTPAGARSIHDRKCRNKVLSDIAMPGYSHTMGTADNGINGAVAEWIRRRAFPALKVGANSLLLGDGKLYTSAGITAGIDLCVALIEEDFGRPTALAVARELVIFMKRPIPRSNSSGNGVER